MAKGGVVSTYYPEPYTGGGDPELMRWLQQELMRISQTFEAAPAYYIDKFHREPDRPREGAIVLADGSDWDPGAGGGAYIYREGVGWVPLFTYLFGTVTSVDVAGTDGITDSGGPITTAGVITLGLGDITPDSVASSGTVTGSNLSGTNTGDQTITLTGDVTGSGTGTFAVDLSDTGVTPGTYTLATITVDAEGRISAASSGTSSADSYYEPVTNGDPVNPEILFDGFGDVIMVEVFL